MKKLLLILTSLLFLAYISRAQDQNYVTYEGADTIHMNTLGDPPNKTEIAANPFKTGLNTSENVAKLTRTSSAPEFFGFWAPPNSGDDSTKYLNITSTNKYVHVKVYFADTTDVDSLVFNLEWGGHKARHEFKSTTNFKTIELNKWQDFVWDASSFTTGYYMIVGVQVRGHATTLASDQIIYIDDIIVSSSAAPFTGGATKIKDITESGYSIYPNPAVSEFTIGNAINISSVAIYDVTGKQVKNISFSSNGSISVPVDDMASGIYIVSIVDNSGNISTSKLFKK